MSGVEMSPELQAFQEEISSALVDLVAAIQDGKTPMQEIGTTLSDLVVGFVAEGVFQ